MADDIRFFELNTGAKIPSIGLGTWQSSPGVVGDAVHAAVKEGYRHIDCAQIYGNEKEIGLVLKKLIEDGVVKREDLWITSRLWDIHHWALLEQHGSKLGKTSAQVTLRWGLQMGHNLVPKSTNPERIQEIFDIFDWSIPDGLFAKFSEINQERLIKGTGFVHETLGAYRTVEEPWDGE